MQEIWKDIPGYEERYQASNLGRIRSLPYTYKQAKGYRTRGGQILKPSQKGNGYVRVTLKGKQQMIHRLVAQTFIPNPDNKRTVNHKDGNKLNNSVDNLEWATYQENNIHAFENGLINTRKKVRCIETNKIYKSVAEANLHSKGNITNCCKNKKLTSGGYHYEYIE